MECLAVGQVKRETLRVLHRPNYAFYAKIIESGLYFRADFIFVIEKEKKEGFIPVLTFYYNITFQNVKINKNVIMV